LTPSVGGPNPDPNAPPAPAVTPSPAGTPPVDPNAPPVTPQTPPAGTPIPDPKSVPTANATPAAAPAATPTPSLAPGLDPRAARYVFGVPQVSATGFLVLTKNSLIPRPCEGRYMGKVPGRIFCFNDQSTQTLACPGNRITTCPTGQRCVDKHGQAACTPNVPEAHARTSPCDMMGNSPKICIGKANRGTMSCPDGVITICSPGEFCTYPAKGPKVAQCMKF